MDNDASCRGCGATTGWLWTIGDEHWCPWCMAAEIERLRADNARLLRAYIIAFDATYQGHDCHWDSTGRHGQNCPACIAAREARARADAIYDHLQAREVVEATKEKEK